MDKFVRRLDDLGRPWVLGHGTLDGWERRLWPLDRFDQRLCPMGGGGGGLGFGVGATIGVSLAVGRDTTVINLQPDGDLLFTPSALWTVAHHDLPILTVVLNNRQYGNTAAHALTMAAARNRPVERFRVGNEIDLPAIDYAALAESMGIWSCGPIDTPDALDEALNAAGEVVAAGHPALIEVLTPPVGPG
jgi:thiamine pyrophosphate-dependent acetolactate synthase large subunit-like protein